MASKTLFLGSFTFVFILIKCASVFYTQGTTAGFQTLATEIFTAESILHQNVDLAINASPEYTIWAFLAILNSLIILYLLVKAIVWLIVNISGAQAAFGAWLIAIAAVAIIELVAVKLINGTFAFIPIKDGLFYLLIHLQPVFTNIHFF